MTSPLESAVEALRSRPAAPLPPAPDAAAVVARLAAALRDQETRFLDDYLLVLVSHNDAEIKAITDELMRKVEGALLGAGERGAGGVVLASWLGAAVAWRTPSPPAAPRALRAVLQDLVPQQVAEVARALHASLGPRELLAVSDALRGAAARGLSGEPAARAWALTGQGGLAALLLRAALGALLATEVAWRAGALGVEELRATLAARWDTLDAEAQLMCAGVAARVLAGAAAGAVRAGGPGGAAGAGGAARGDGPAAARLLAALAHPPPRALRHHPDYLKAIIALSKLQRLFQTEPPARRE